MKDWFLSRTPRERGILMAGAAAVSLLLMYVAAWEPLSSDLTRSRELVAAKRATLQQMQRSAARVEAMRNQGAARTPAGTSQSLLSLIDTSAREFHLQSFVRRVEPVGTDRARLWLERAPFDALVQWLASLQAQYGVSVGELVASRQEPGMVEARLTLKQGAP